MLGGRSRGRLLRMPGGAAGPEAFGLARAELHCTCAFGTHRAQQLQFVDGGNSESGGEMAPEVPLREEPFQEGSYRSLTRSFCIYDRLGVERQCERKYPRSGAEDIQCFVGEIEFISVGARF